jgi:NDP-sugar pyrophosphorylase family protein
VRAVILAGGKGRRLLPYTAIFPKPLVPIGEQPILSIIIDQLRCAGVSHVTLAVGHLAGLIQAYFGDGSQFGVEIEYSMEREPLGTAGPLSQLRRMDDDFLVMNGDVLTDLDPAALMRAHRAAGAIGTIAVYRKSVDVSLGVLTLGAGDEVVGYDEKPRMHYLASTGIYCFSPEVLEHLEPGVRCDLPDLVRRLVARGKVVHGHRFDGSWLDIGRPEDYEVAQRLFAKRHPGTVPESEAVPTALGDSEAAAQ